MKMIDVNREQSDISMTREELLIVNSALNEICNEMPALTPALRGRPFSAAKGSPCNPRFEGIFGRVGINLECALNKIQLPGRKGLHPQEYKQAVYDRLTGATDGLDGKAFKEALQN